ncbi:MAG TPA: glycoside hydrolase family 3 protein [Propionibacterium sp.]|nr:glycoside hydrolase family 3 protein [Propionibacterium sp.]
MEQPALEVRTKKLIEIDGYRFKDLNGNGELDPYEDWRLSPAERAADLVSRMSVDEKVGLMLINSRFTGYQTADDEPKSHDGILDEREIEAGTSIFATRRVYPTTETIQRMHLRHFILRENESPSRVAAWNNAMNEVCEETRLGIPCITASNSRNENGEMVFGMNDAVGIFSTFPATMGLASAVLGDKADGGDASLIDGFAEAVRMEWTATGLRKGYMYMADVVTDPRWQRIYGTFGEDPELVSDIIARLVQGLQGDELGPDSLSTTIKHFPGGGPRDNGFDPHYVEGKWNCYPTPGSLDDYHMPPFKAAAAKAASFMPYYSAPSIKRSVVQAIDGEDVPYEETGFAFNHYFLNHVLRERLGFTGYVNSDSGITDNMCWGVEDLSRPERFAKAVMSGTDIIADTNNIEDLRTAIDNHWISDARVDEACQRLLIEMFALGLFDDRTYVDAEAADRKVAESPGWALAEEAHRKSVVVLRNSGGTLPLAAGTSVYVELFHKDPEQAATKTAQAREEAAAAGVSLADDPAQADAVVLFLDPQSGDYFSATPGLLELTICEDKPLTALNGDAYTETTIANLARFRELAQDARGRGAKVIISVNVSLPWILDDVEPLADALVAGFSTFYGAQFDVLTGKHPAHGKLPITLPASEAVIAVDADGVCVSPNDVPGYDKEKYMPEGMTYAYVDADGNTYRLGHGLRY